MYWLMAVSSSARSWLSTVSSVSLPFMFVLRSGCENSVPIPAGWGGGSLRWDLRLYCLSLFTPYWLEAVIQNIRVYVCTVVPGNRATFDLHRMKLRGVLPKWLKNRATQIGFKIVL